MGRRYEWAPMGEDEEKEGETKEKRAQNQEKESDNDHNMMGKCW